MIGAGVSTATTCAAPTWTDLIRNGLTYAMEPLGPAHCPPGWADLIAGNRAFDEAGLLETADHLSMSLDAPRGGFWVDWLNKSVGRFDPSAALSSRQSTPWGCRSQRATSTRLSRT